MSPRSESLHTSFVRRVARVNARSPHRAGTELNLLSQEVGGHPEATGTFPLFRNRVVKLHQLIATGGYFYEPLSSYEELLYSARLNDLLVRGNAPTQALNNLSVSVRVFESVYGAPRGVLPLPEHGETEQGVHHVSIDGPPTRGGGLRFVNTWGGGWGHGGQGVLSREYLNRFMVEAWLIRRSEVGPTRFALPLLERNASNQSAFVAAWVPTLPVLGQKSFAMLEQRARHDGMEYLVSVRETLSTSGDPVEMIELHDSSGVPLGWAHLHHLVSSQPRVSQCKEFFVWPLVRQRGIGRILERYVAERAKEWRSERVEVMFHEADDHSGSTRAAKAFALTTSYEWSWISGQRPNVSAIASKGL
jgi:GNAT superfamily N-acetyltransferase